MECAPDAIAMRRFRWHYQQQTLHYNVARLAVVVSRSQPFTFPHRCAAPDAEGVGVETRPDSSKFCFCHGCGRTHVCRREPGEAADPCLVTQSDSDYVCLLSGNVLSELGHVICMTASYDEYMEQRRALGVVGDGDDDDAWLRQLSSLSLRSAQREYHKSTYYLNETIRNSKYKALEMAQTTQTATRNAMRLERQLAQLEQTGAGDLPPPAKRRRKANRGPQWEKPSPPPPPPPPLDIKRIAVAMPDLPVALTPFEAADSQALTANMALHGPSLRDSRYWTDCVFGGRERLEQMFGMPLQEARAIFSSNRRRRRVDPRASPSVRAPHKWVPPIGCWRLRQLEAPAVDVSWLLTLRHKLQRFVSWMTRELTALDGDSRPDPAPLDDYVDTMGRWARLVMVTHSNPIHRVFPPLFTLVAYFRDFAPRHITISNGLAQTMTLFAPDRWAQALAAHQAVEQAVFHRELALAAAENPGATVRELVQAVIRARSDPPASQARARVALFAESPDDHVTVAQMMDVVAMMQKVLTRAKGCGTFLLDWFHSDSGRVWPPPHY